jgi:hypothetical protein
VSHCEDSGSRTVGIEQSAVVHDPPDGERRRVQRARGYRYIMVNSEVTFVDGQPTNTARTGFVTAAR